MTAGTDTLSLRDRLLEMTVRHHRYVVPARIILDVIAICSAIGIAIYLRLDLNLKDDTGQRLLADRPRDRRPPDRIRIRVGALSR